MQNVARFITRPASEAGTTPGQTDLFIGVMARAAAHLLKPNTIYQIREILGELVIEEVGPAVFGSGQSHTLGTWGQSVGDILNIQGRYLYLTKEEYAQCHPVEKE